jgi:hypothetical protein
VLIDAVGGFLLHTEAVAHRASCTFLQVKKCALAAHPYQFTAATYLP